MKELKMEMRQHKEHLVLNPNLKNRKEELPKN
jgi:hypothetical protein